jgi:hypothetical protein
MSMQNLFTGKDGAITLSKTGLPELSTETGDADKVLQAYFANAAPVIGRATGIHVAVQTDLEEFHQIGARHAQVLHPGNIHISGSIDRAYISGALIMLLLGRGAAASNKEPYFQPSFSISVTMKDPGDPNNNSATLVLDGVKFQNWGMKMPEDDFVMENLTFRALTLQVVDSDPKANPLEGLSPAAS